MVNLKQILALSAALTYLVSAPLNFIIRVAVTFVTLN